MTQHYVCIKNLPTEHVRPEYPGKHVQFAVAPWLTQVPPCSQARLLQGSVKVMTHI